MDYLSSLSSPSVPPQGYYMNFLLLRLLERPAFSFLTSQDSNSYGIFPAFISPPHPWIWTLTPFLLRNWWPCPIIPSVPDSFYLMFGSSPSRFQGTTFSGSTTTNRTTTPPFSGPVLYPMFSIASISPSLPISLCCIHELF